MVIKIDGKECRLNFGVGFIRELDHKYYIESKTGARFGNGLETKVPMLLSGDPVTLAEFIFLGTAGMEKGRPSLKDVDGFIDHVDDIEGLFDEVVEELKKSNACKVKVRQMEDNMKKAEERLKKEGAMEGK